MFHISAQHNVKNPPAQFRIPANPAVCAIDPSRWPAVDAFVCSSCGSLHDSDRSCGCYDNNSQ